MANQPEWIVWHTAAHESTDVPMPFLLAILAQESGLRHYRVPRGETE